MIAVTPFEDQVNRIEKLLVESRHAGSFEEAAAALSKFSVCAYVGDDAIHDAKLQIAVLTFVQLATRFALGGVYIRGDIDGPNLLPQFDATSFRELLSSAGAIHFGGDRAEI